LLRARDYLKERFKRKGEIMYTDEATIDRKQQIWQYAVDVGNGLWRESGITETSSGVKSLRIETRGTPLMSLSFFICRSASFDL
ncbi:hypothetical protein SB767_29560, partial [Bacillus sp. SIMBA_069]